MRRSIITSSSRSRSSRRSRRCKQRLVGDVEVRAVLRDVVSGALARTRRGSASYGEFGKLATHLRFADRATNKLGRSIFHAMVRFGPKLERRQMVLFRAVDIGAELFAMSAACSRAQMLAKQGREEAVTLADVFCIEARQRIRAHFRALFGPTDPALYKVAMQVLRGEHAWLEQGIVGLTPADPTRSRDRVGLPAAGEPRGRCQRADAIGAARASLAEARAGGSRC